MDKFPENFTRDYFEKELRKNQDKIIQQTRKVFSDSILKQINEFYRVIILRFDDKMWKISRFEIIQELLDIHGSLQITTMSGKSFEINITSDLPQKEIIDCIIISF